ncbi:MAG: hypothetical protein AB7M05_21015 [Alphaproteobacteria bacterium]
MGIDKLKQARDHLRNWLEQSRSIASAAPGVKKIEEQLDWEVRTLEGRPAEAVNLSTTGIDERSDDLLSRVQSYYPSLPIVDSSGFTFVNSITTSTSSATVQFVMSVDQVGTPAAVAYASRALDEYRIIQRNQNRDGELRSMLQVKLPSVLSRFDAAQSAYEKARVGHNDAAAAAIAARNFVDGLKGELVERARKAPGESISVDQAVSRLFAGSPMEADVTHEMNKRGDLIAGLSDVAKARRPASTADIEGLWSRVLDHAFVVMQALP